MKKESKLRFNEFNDQYLKTNLNNICKINPRSVAPNKINYISLESVIDGKLLSYTVESKATAPSRVQRLLQKNDILYQTVRPYQNNNFIFKMIVMKILLLQQVMLN